MRTRGTGEGVGEVEVGVGVEVSMDVCERQFVSVHVLIVTRTDWR
jgi:hypothetical protein